MYLMPNPANKVKICRIKAKSGYKNKNIYKGLQRTCAFVYCLCFYHMIRYHVIKVYSISEYFTWLLQAGRTVTVY